ncbi:hypothetical protein SAMN05216411_11738 [Nitrosospira multiformis]|nr:hypothetical protein SAMN05216411_11738 [Nitrosospira multiformis]
MFLAIPFMGFPCLQSCQIRALRSAVIAPNTLTIAHLYKSRINRAYAGDCKDIGALRLPAHPRASQA